LNDEWAKDKAQREQRVSEITKQLASGAASARRDHVGLTPQRSPQWYVNSQGQTMIVIPGPVEFLMGSPESEAGRKDNENQHKRRIARTFALAAKSVTVEQYRKFNA